MIDVETTCHKCGTVTVQRVSNICDNCTEDDAYKREHSRCRAYETTCKDGADCPDFVEECDCLECWPIDEEHDRYYEDRDVLNRIAED